MRLLAAHAADFFAQTSGFQRVANRDLQFVELWRLGNEIIRAVAQRRDRVFDHHVRRNHNHDGLGLQSLNFLQDIQPRTVGQINVEEDRRRALRLERKQCACDCASLNRLITPRAQGFGQCPANHGFIINDQNFFFCHSDFRQRAICLPQGGRAIFSGVFTLYKRR